MPLPMGLWGLFDSKYHTGYDSSVKRMNIHGFTENIIDAFSLPASHSELNSIQVKKKLNIYFSPSDIVNKREPQYKDDNKHPKNGGGVANQDRTTNVGKGQEMDN